MKNVYGVNNPREEVFKGVIETPSQLVKNDAANKKSAIYHPPVKSGKTHAQEKREYKEKCGDVHAIKLGKPMDWTKFVALSDDTKREYLESVFSKYPDITARTICSVFNSCFRANEIKDEILRLGFDFTKANDNKFVQAKISRAITDEKQDEIETAAAKATKPKPVSYKQLRKWPADKAFDYLQNLYDYYHRSLSLGDFRDLLSAGNGTIRNFMVSIGFDVSSWAASRNSESLVYRSIFREEMLGGAKEKVADKKSKKKAEPDAASAKPVSKDEKKEEPVAVSIGSASEVEKKENVETNEVSTKKNNVQISNIGIIVDASDIDSIAEALKSFSGSVKIHIERA